MTVHLVTGPPCSGKSTYVNAHRTDGDEVVCFDTTLDAVRAAAPARSDWTHRQAALQITNDCLDDLVAGIGVVTHDVWVIRTMAGRRRRATLLADLARHHDVQHHHLVPPLAELRARAAYRPDPHKTRRDIDAWFTNEERW